jgi:hypothetical protein
MDTEALFKDVRRRVAPNLFNDLDRFVILSQIAVFSLSVDRFSGCLLATQGEQGEQ